MPITLVTGLPGHGKSLYAVSRIAERFKDRDVYYHNIKDLKLPWLPIPDPERWFDLPAGSVMVFDECQDIFPTRDGKTPVPEKCKKFEIHRHAGHDIVLITQRPRQIDVHVRQLVGEHIHVERKLGAQKAITFTWPKVCEDVDDYHARKDSAKGFFPYPKEAYNYYHSAEVHTVKRKLPMWLLLIPLSVLVLGFCAYIFQNALFGSKTSKPAGPGTSLSIPTGSNPVSLPNGSKAPKLGYIQARVPEVRGFPETAPAYEGLTQPKQVPYPAACVNLKGVCRCWTQQATRLDTPPEICAQIVDRGYFIEWLPENVNRGMGRATPHGDRNGKKIYQDEGTEPLNASEVATAPLETL